MKKALKKDAAKKEVAIKAKKALESKKKSPEPILPRSSRGRPISKSPVPEKKMKKSPAPLI